MWCEEEDGKRRLVVKLEPIVVQQYQEKIGRWLTPGESKKATGWVEFCVKGELKCAKGNIPKYLEAESIIRWWDVDPHESDVDPSEKAPKV